MAIGLTPQLPDQISGEGLYLSLGHTTGRGGAADIFVRKRTYESQGSFRTDAGHLAAKFFFCQHFVAPPRMNIEQPQL